MAKQRGIHQISGKINNLCYYEQKYVRGGLIRRINEAMSERLKIDPVFVNTRYANKIFGGCSQYAKTFLSFFGSRNTYLFLPFRQARLTEIIRKNCLTFDPTFSYPFIELNRPYLYLVSNIFDSIFKNPLRDNFPSIPVFMDDLELDATYRIEFPKEELSNYCKKYKCKKVQVTVTQPHYIYGSRYDESTGSYSIPDANPGGRGVYSSWEDTDNADDLTFTLSTGGTDDAFTFWIVYVTPVLREYRGRSITGQAGASVGIISFKAD